MLPKKYCGLLFYISLLCSNTLSAGIVTGITVEPMQLCAESSQLSVITGNKIIPLTGYPVQNIILLRYADTDLTPVVFQVDQKNSEDRYVLDEIPRDNIFDKNDELVLSTVDAGKKLP